MSRAFVVNKEPLRQRHAHVTRGAILEAARTLFFDQGYASTSVRRLADAAGVAVQTVYATFGSKAGVLLGLLDAVDDTSVRPIVVRMGEIDDPGELLDLVATMQRRVREHGAALFRLVAQVAPTDPEVAAVWEQGFGRHRQGIADLCQRLGKRRHLRKGISVEDAIATMLALTSLEAYDELVHRRKWTPDRYERWLAKALRQSLLA